MRFANSALSSALQTPEDVVVVGGGASGVAVVLHLLEKIKQGKRMKSITLLEKSKAAGPGLAYSEACAGTILNMHADTMGLYINDHLHFSKWRAARYPDLQPEPFPLRSQYGQYLRSQLEIARKESCRLDVVLNVICGEVVDVQRKRGGFLLELTSRIKINTQVLVLALGNFAKVVHPGLLGVAGYFPSPWPNSALKIIPPESPVSVLGTGLTAIDVAICLSENGHEGPIHLVSRSGRLPKVQGHCEPYSRRYVLHCLARDVEQRPERSFIRIIETISQELDRGACGDSSQTQSSTDSLTEFQASVNAAENHLVQWQAVFRATAPVVERYWHTFPNSTKDLFLGEFFSTWMTYRHSIPLENARKIVTLISRGQLRVHCGEKAFLSGDEFLVSTTSGLVQSPWLIEAAGQEHDPYKSGSELLKRLLDAGELTVHPAGGVVVDFNTLAASENLYVIGSMTRGTHFYTGAIDRNVAHAARIADSISGERPSRPLHVGLFVGTDIFSHLMTSKIVSRLLALGHTPFIFLPAHKGSKKQKHFDLEELAFFERQLYQDIVIPFLGTSDPSGSMCMTVEQMRVHYGILVQHILDVNDPAFLDVLQRNFIDIGMSIRCYQKFGKGIINHFSGSRKLLNLHPGVLPNYRGVMTTIRAMRNGDESFGYSLHEINEDWDAGHILDIRTCPLTRKPMLQYMNDVYDVGVEMAVDSVDKISRGEVLAATEQSEADSRYYPFPTTDELADYRQHGLSLVNPEEMVDSILDSLSTPRNRTEFKETLQKSISHWYRTKRISKRKE
ncbi:hypothetical protein M438DRAFT_285793 [Aureobasidium pullulans EXF-150]|uniref:FAD/NAD(P)-binding domain-containing protein n=1 Tax=Aureobasidium pullulans EXF-150 TaxID=1043002 RepID=A0A074WYX1_AURPU|nr:uncharacterized protein M438DRAFT_285793 [Aureobasidium pullulans EXF-150]KEQ78398.1 hypothetical protein M438DRAFT_285793 [Aureobasidium pullulans EXF-150]